MHFATSNKVHDTFGKVPGLLVVIFSVIRRCLTKVRFKYCGEVSLITEPDTICYLAKSQSFPSFFDAIEPYSYQYLQPMRLRCSLDSTCWH